MTAPRRRTGIIPLVAGVAAFAAALVTVAAGPALADPPTPPAVTVPAGSTTPSSATSDSGARVVSQKWLDARTLDLQVASPAVGTTVPVRLLVPAGWSPDAARTWPVVLMLHGGQDDYTSWTRETDLEAKAATAQALVVMPDAGYTAAYTDYFAPGTAGGKKWETFHTVELLQLLERGYHAGTQRAVAGLSLGGLGAMSYAGRHPELFKYAASYSGPTSIRIPGARAVLIGIFQDAEPFSRYGVPYLDEKNWTAHDPAALAKNFKGMGLYISCGTTGFPAEDDTTPWAPIQFAEPVIAAMNADFIAQLDKNEIPVTKHFYTLGEHNWVSWQRELDASWPLMLKAIGA